MDPDKVVEEILDVVEQINHLQMNDCLKRLQIFKHLHNKFKEAPQQPHCKPLSALMDCHLGIENRILNWNLVKHWNL